MYDTVVPASSEVGKVAGGADSAPGGQESSRVVRVMNAQKDRTVALNE